MPTPNTPASRPADGAAVGRASPSAGSASVRTTPLPVMSNAQDSTSATGKPSAATINANVDAQCGADSTSNAVSVISSAIQTTTTYAPATRHTWRRFISAKKRFRPMDPSTSRPFRSRTLRMRRPDDNTPGNGSVSLR